MKKPINAIIFSFLLLISLTSCSKSEVSEEKIDENMSTEMTDNIESDNKNGINVSQKPTGSKYISSATELQNKDMGEEEDTEKDIQVISTDIVKEFKMDSYSQEVNGKSAPRFSLDTIEVNQGDTVKIIINVTSGRHDFKIDEFDIYEQTPTGFETVVKFVASKKGEFVYYCNKPGHREAGHFGKLIVR